MAGVAAVIFAAALAGTGVPARSYLSAAGPALLIGMGIGRLGCFWAGKGSVGITVPKAE